MESLPKHFFLEGGLVITYYARLFFMNLEARHPKCWMLSHYPKIFQNNPCGLQVVPDDWRTKTLEKINRPSTLLYYGKWIGDNDRIGPPKKHIIAEILEKCDITGDVCPTYWYATSLPLELFLRRNIFVYNLPTLIHPPDAK